MQYNLYKHKGCTAFAFTGQIFQSVARPSNVDNHDFNFAPRPRLSTPKPMEGTK